MNLKMMMLLHLEDDDARVKELLTEHGVMAWSRVPLDGYGPGFTGWYGTVAPYRSRMTFTLVPGDRTEALLGAVRELDGLADPRHPVHAYVMPVEAQASSGAAGGQA
jgi:hypothetical protein